MKIKPCKKCGSTDIKIWDCGYTTFNPGGGTCNKCGYCVKSNCWSWNVKENVLIEFWNKGQKPNAPDKLKIERAKTKKLRKQLRDNGFTPIV